LDLKEPQKDVCYITVIPTVEKDAIESDCDSDSFGFEENPLPLVGESPTVSTQKPRSQTRKRRCPEENDTPQPKKRRCPEENETPQPKKRRCPEENETPKRQKNQKKTLQNKQNKDRIFKRSRRPATSGIPDFVTYGPTAADCIKQTKPDPVDLFLLMYPPTLRELTVEMSNLYSMQTKGKALDLSMDELLSFYGVLLASGYSSVPRRHMYWSYDPDVYNEAISNAIRRNRFDEIMASIHLVDNSKATDDPFYKVRPIFSALNSTYKMMPYTKQLSIDESMIRYYGRHGCKQFIRGKPIRFGYKLWSLASPTGYMFHMEPYCGVHTHLPETGLGQGPSVVLGLAEQAEVPPGCTFVHDNLFTSLSLIDEMTKQGYGSLGTLRQCRLHDIPFTGVKDFEKMPRGSTEVLTEGEKLLVRWKDNSVVTMATNAVGRYSEGQASRWSKEKKAFVKVPQPLCFLTYNQNMGGVDLHDLHVSRYRSAIRSKKWWWPILAWSLHSAVVNSWLFFRDVVGSDYDLLTFQRVLSLDLLKRYGKQPLGQGRRSAIVKPQDSTRGDGKHHWPVNTGKRYQRCRRCYNRTVYGCEKCDVPLHIECFKIFHGE
uniref:PiggyBac transposable element-derived protein domain-containing protein n=1 Tax=Seriola dumerili TaxID=41447 RepID=A0A3B4VB30_SERDU